jgi:hypothetical protein
MQVSLTAAPLCHNHFHCAKQTHDRQISLVRMILIKGLGKGKGNTVKGH